MATNLTDTAFKDTYKDDFTDSANFHRILFNSGRALQARELTQLQTIIQTEMQRFGANIFKEGGKVNGGNVTLNRREFIKLATNALPSDSSTVVNQTFTDGDGIKVKILKAVDATGSDPDTIYVEYIDTLTGTAGTDQVRCANGGTLTHSAGTLDPMTIAASAATGRGLEASITQGHFFVQGHFVFVKAQSIFVDKYVAQPTKEIGFKIVQDIVSTADNSALFDNQGASPNEAAPGADRLRITLTLSLKDDITASDNFVFLGEVVNGVMAKEVTNDDAYNTLGNVLARRTKEESGDYIVEQYTAKFEPLNDSNLTLDVTGGLAYVDGYRIVTGATEITVPKAQTTKALTNDAIVPQYGNFVLFDSNYNLPELHAKSLLFNMELDSAAATAQTLGTARIRHYEEDGANHRAYLYDVQMKSGKSFNNVKAIGEGHSATINLVLDGNGKSTPKDVSGNSLLFPLSRIAPSTLLYNTGVSIITQQKYTVTTNSSGVLASAEGIANGGTGGVFTSTSQWIAVRTDGKIDPDVAFSLPSTTTFNITSGADNSQEYDVYALQKRVGGTGNFQFKALTKSLSSPVEHTVSLQNDLDSDGNGTKFFSLRKCDVYKMDMIKLNDSTGSDLTSFFNFDNGQRDNFYGIGRLVLKSGQTLPTGNLFVRFKHFTAGTSPQTGTHFDVTSYPTGDSVGYTGIPSHRLNDGTTVSLRDVLDFRPYAAILADSAGVMSFTFDSSGTTATVIPQLPVPGVSFDVNPTFNLPRNDRLVVRTSDDPTKATTPKGGLHYIQGVPDFEPQLPPLPDGALPIYNFFLEPFTLNESDLSSEILEAKRFTMADIADLEDDIADLKELVLLNTLENATQSLTVLDSAGLARTKAGFLVDNFQDYTFAAEDRLEYRAAIEPLDGVLRPLAIGNEIKLNYDSDNSSTSRGAPRASVGYSGRPQSGDLVTLEIDSDHIFIDQDLCTETENINPFAVLTGKGTLELSPASDTWIERRTIPALVVDGGTIRKTVNVTVLNGGKLTNKQGPQGSTGKGGGGPDAGGGSCFAIGTLLLLANGVLKAIENIDIGDILMEGGRVRTLIIGDGSKEDWYMYGSTKLTGSHTVYENGEWKRVSESVKAVRSTPEKRIYTLINEEHRVVAADGTIFGDYDEVDNRDIEPQLLEIMNKENVPHAVRKVEAA